MIEKEEYLKSKEVVAEYEKQLNIHIVCKTLPTDDEIETQAEKALFGFGKGRQYDDDYCSGYEHGAKWIRDNCGYVSLRN